MCFLGLSSARRAHPCIPAELEHLVSFSCIDNLPFKLKAQCFTFKHSLKHCFYLVAAIYYIFKKYTSHFFNYSNNIRSTTILYLSLPYYPWPWKVTKVLPFKASQAKKVHFDGTADRSRVEALAVSLLCSAGQSFSHQFDMRGILLSGKHSLFRENRLFHECQEGIVCSLLP